VVAVALAEGVEAVVALMELGEVSEMVKMVTLAGSDWLGHYNQSKPTESKLIQRQFLLFSFVQ